MIPYDDECVALSKAVMATLPDLNANRRFALENHIITSIGEWVERQRIPCDACGKPFGGADHSECILF
jgi:hypothetical protein